MNQLTKISNVHSNEKHDAKVFSDLEEIFDCTNKTFFEGALEQPVFSFTRDPRVKGAFLPDRYHSVAGEQAHGIALNSAYARSIGDAACMAQVGFLVAQSARRQIGPVGKNGKCGTPGYIDVWTRDRLGTMGLRSVDEVNPERQLGYGLSVQVIDEGPFDLMCREMLIAGFAIRWHERPVVSDPDADDADQTGEPTAKPQTRARFQCNDCGTKAYAKPSAHLLCGCNGLPLECTSNKG